MSRNVTELIKQFTKPEIINKKHEKVEKVIGKHKKLPKMKTELKVVPHRLKYDKACESVKAYLNADKGKKSKMLVLTKNEQNKINNMSMKEKVRVEELMKRIIRFAFLFEDTLKAGRSVNWHFTLYALAMSFLHELMNATLDAETDSPFPITNVNDRRF